MASSRKERLPDTRTEEGKMMKKKMMKKKMMKGKKRGKMMKDY
jgi:hypothetical protein